MVVGIREDGLSGQQGGYAQGRPVQNGKGLLPRAGY